MPFTFSHPALILPLTYLPQKWFSLTGLIIGSITPDFEYFIRMKIQSDYSHTIGGLFWFNLPLGIILAFLFHNVVRNTLFNNLPEILKSRLSKFKSFKWKSYFKSNWIVVLVSIFTGAASHILWDSFTHDHGYFVEKIPALSSQVSILGFQVPILKILQHSSTLIGGIIVLYAFYKIPKEEINRTKINVKYWGIIVILSFGIIAARLIGGLDYKLFGHLIVTFISAILISIIVSSLIFRNENT